MHVDDGVVKQSYDFAIMRKGDQTIVFRYYLNAEAGASNPLTPTTSAGPSCFLLSQQLIAL